MNPNPKHAAIACVSILLPLLSLAGCGGSSATPPVASAPSQLANASSTPAKTVDSIPTQSPTQSLYPPLKVMVGCSADNGMAVYIVGGPAPDPHIQISWQADFGDASGQFALEPRYNSYSTSRVPSEYPDGVYVRWTGDPSVTAHGVSPGPCANLPISKEQMAAACAHGTAISQAGIYTASVHPHPLVLVTHPDNSWQYWNYAIAGNFNAIWYSPWPSPVQLIVCESARTAVKAGSCGWYKKAGVTGEVVRYKDNVTVRAIVARTGKVLSSKTFVGFVPTCDTSKIENESPPWEIHGAPNSSAIQAYELSLSK